MEMNDINRFAIILDSTNNAYISAYVSPSVGIYSHCHVVLLKHRTQCHISRSGLSTSLFYCFMPQI